MTIETDLLIDRGRLKRRLSLWRVIAVLAIVACGVIATRGAGIGIDIGRPHLARLNVNGIISEDRRLTEAVAGLAKDDNVAALIVSIDSPGGSVSGGEALHDAIAKVAAVKPVVTVMGGTAASAGYMIAVPAARIFAREATLTGSIGVILETGDISQLLATLGIAAYPIVSGPLKDQPSYVKPLSPEGREVLQGLVMDLYDQFVLMVSAGRHMDAARVRELADGRAYTGRQALKLGLVDAIGGEPDAREWLASVKHVAADLPVSDVKIGTLAERTFGQSLSNVVISSLKSLVFQGLKLDGAWALWQPSGG